MAESNSDEKPRTLIAIEADEHSKDTRHVLYVLARMGLSPEVVREYNDLQGLEAEGLEPYPIDQITSREQCMGREHFLSFRDRYAPEFHESLAARVFYAYTGQEATRVSPELDIKSRQEAGLPLFPPRRYRSGSKSITRKLDRAISVDQFLRFTSLVNDLSYSNKPGPYGVGALSFDFISKMAEFLEVSTVPEEA
jgi:hypothetical protein